MGKKSIKENKNIYQLAREELGLTREQAAEKLIYVSADRIEKIESERSLPHPEEVLVMQEAYKQPTLCNYYCTHDCEIGKKFVPEIEQKDISRITLEVLDTLNKLDREKQRLVEIAVDGQISEDELADFNLISDELDQIASCVSSLKVWIEEAKNNGSYHIG